MELCRASLVIVVLATLGVCVLSSADIIEEVIQRLEEYVTGARTETGLTKEDLIAMAQAWNSQSEEEKTKALQHPHYKLLYHFGIIPAEHICKQPDDVITAHIHRFEQAYKRFLPAYQGKTIDNFERGDMKMRKLGDLFSKLINNEPCTLKDFELAKMEHAAWLARYEDIVNHEDVYANLNELRNIMNYCNGNLLKILLYHVLPRLGEINDPAALKQLYYDKVRELARLRFDNGDTVPV